MSATDRPEQPAPPAEPTRAPQPPGPSGTGAGRRRAQARAATMIAVLVAAGVAAGVLWQGSRGDGVEARAEPVVMAPAQLAESSGRGGETSPPWSAPSDVPARVAEAGLTLGEMGMAEHYHAHLDVIVNGESVPVPAELGVDGATGDMAYLHTHDPSGLVHVEAGTKGQPFSLGQLFTLWNVRLDEAQLGALRTSDGNTLTLYVNGQKVPGNPSMLQLAPYQQIALVYGPEGQDVDVPDSYNFAPGD
jgi:hypothetical protein